jgi:hypothetical protein
VSSWLNVHFNLEARWFLSETRCEMHFSDCIRTVPYFEISCVIVEAGSAVIVVGLSIPVGAWNLAKTE